MNFCYPPQLNFRSIQMWLIFSALRTQEASLAQEWHYCFPRVRQQADTFTASNRPTKDHLDPLHTMKNATKILTLAAVIGAGVITPAQATAATATDLHSIPGLEALNVELPSYPLKLLNAGVTGGTVKLIVEVDSDGTVSDYLVTEYSHAGFARAAEAAVANWRFAPSSTDAGEAVIHRLELNLHFDVNNLVAVEFRPVADQAAPGRMVATARSPQALDRPLNVLKTVAPAYPEEWKTQGIAGSVVLSYYVDESGQVRVPNVEECSHTWLASVALDAIKGWKFAVPVADGEPALVQVRQTFNFKAGPQVAVR